MDENIKGTWLKCLDLLKKRTNKVVYEAYISSCTLAALNKEAVIVVEDDFVRARIEKSASANGKNNVYAEISHALSEVTGKEYTLSFVKEYLPQKKEEKPSSSDAPVKKSGKDDFSYSNLNPRFTFDSFVVGKSNNFAYSAATAVASHIGEKYNPLFIYGNSGLGKTHLLHAIGNEIKKNHPEMKVIFITTENFTNDFIDSLRNKTPMSFREKYRKVDVLLIDDIQFIAKATTTQEEFFNTFNTLHDAGKQIVVSCDRPISELSILEDRLKTRLTCGLISDIQAPDYETKYAILEKKAEENDFEIEDDIIDFLALSSGENVRELEGIINQFSLSVSQGRDITMNLAKETIKRLKSNDVNEISVGIIIDFVSRYFNVSVDDILSKKRNREIAYPRHIAIYLCRTLTNLSFPELGKAFNGMHHTSVMGAYEGITEKLISNDELKATIEELRVSLSNKI